MKKVFSFFKLAARSSIYRVLVLFGIIFIIQAVLFGIAAAVSGPDAGLEEILYKSRLQAAAGIALIAVCIVLSLPWRRGAAANPHLMLVRTAGKSTGVAYGILVYNICVIFMFWVVQLTGVIILSILYLKITGSGDMMSGLFLACWRNGYFHTLLPLSDVWRIFRNAAMVLMLGIVSAAMGFVAEPLKWTGLVLAAAVAFRYAGFEAGSPFYEGICIVLSLAIGIIWYVLLINACKKGDEPDKHGGSWDVKPEEGGTL